MMPSRFKFVLPLLLAVCLLAASSVHAANAKLEQIIAPTQHSTADHSKFKELNREFKNGPEVTKACLICHTEAAKQVQHTKHWTWESTDPKTGKVRGKKNIINNYCTSPVSNENDCMACHAGYGWKDDKFEFKAEQNVDCLVCHDQTGTYRKLPGYAGHPVYKRVEFPHGSGKFVEAVDLKKVAQSIGMPTRSNCGSCHFFGAGGNGAKHGDLDSSLQHPGKYLDVHMDEKGLNFSCTTCHATSHHEVSGSRYDTAAAVKGPAHIRGKKDESPASCQSCHSNKPHHEAMLNQHTDKLACQTCHIPEYARNQIGTEASWDWSLATTMGPDGKRMVRKDSAGRRAFDSQKGEWEWESHVIPEYRWFNGTGWVVKLPFKFSVRAGGLALNSSVRNLTVIVTQNIGLNSTEDANISFRSINLTFNNTGFWPIQIQNTSNSSVSDGSRTINYTLYSALPFQLNSNATGAASTGSFNLMLTINRSITGNTSTGLYIGNLLFNTSTGNVSNQSSR